MSYVMRMEHRSGREKMPRAEKQANFITDKILLRLSHLAIVLLLSLLGFLMTTYVGNLDKTIEKITETQSQLTVVVTRLDENLRNIDRRIEHIENQNP